jgi:pimeloyl-ACP methyl ester carboxylesterase
MTQISDALWLNVSPALQKLGTIAQWGYRQTADEPTSLDVALALLDEYLSECNRPMHLLGHGTAGLLGLLYTQRYPQRVRSLTLLSVGVNPAVNWQSYYYTQRRLLPYDQQTILQRMVCGLLGYHPRDTANFLVRLLAQDLYQSLSPHHLGRSLELLPIAVDVPLLVCGSVDDIVIDLQQLRGWQQHFRSEASRLWVCPGGRHFFHSAYPQLVSEQIRTFWRELPLTATAVGHPVYDSFHPATR